MFLFFQKEFKNDFFNITITTMKLLINVSQIAILTRHNIYQNPRDYLINFWKKTNKDDFLEYQKITGYNEKNDKIVFDAISKKNNLQLQQDLHKCYQSKNTKELDASKELLMKKIQDLNEKDKKEITESIKNLSNTRFGIKNEDDITKMIEKKMNIQIVKDNAYVKKKIIENEFFSIQIGGKIDGINKQDGSIIEVKNRMKKLFLELRDYEKVQLMCYLYLFDSPKGFLVEAFKGKDKTDINIIECPFDELFVQNIICTLEKFGYYYCQFLQNHELKIACLQNEDFVVDF